jgi:hypothetical protein
VRINGIAQAGQTLTAYIDYLDGNGTITHQWRRNGTGGSFNNIGTNSSTYTVQSADEGSTITVTVTRAGYSSGVTSNSIGPVVLPPLTGTVSITGTPQVGQTLTASTGSLGGSGGTISYQWRRETETALIGYNSSYTAQSDDVGYTIIVTVTRSGYSGSVTSTAIGPIGLPVTLSITFSQITDVAPSITGPTLYRVSNGGPTSSTLTVDNPGQYDSISWRVQNTAVTGTGASFTLSAANTSYNLIGEHFVTVLVMKSGVPYNKTVSFKIEY